MPISLHLSLSLGLEHYVFWSGYSPKYGQQPGWSEYIRYITARHGGASAIHIEQINTTGNHLGSYNLEVKKKLATTSATFYYNHPFEDRSGIELANIRDGLWGIHLAKKNRSAFISDVVFEYMNTRNQSGAMQEKPIPTAENPTRVTGRGNDNYFNHSVYTSGYTYFQRMIGTPLFVPIIGADGISKGYESTRMWMHHLSSCGTLGNGFYWKSLTTWSRNFGIYSKAYPVPLDEFSFLAEGSYNSPKLPFIVKAGIASDSGDRFEHRLGGYLGIEFNF